MIMLFPSSRLLYSNGWEYKRYFNHQGTQAGSSFALVNPLYHQASKAQDSAVNWCLLSRPANSTLLDPLDSVVHCDLGTILIPVWSLLTTTFISKRYCSSQVHQNLMGLLCKGGSFLLDQIHQV